MSDPVSIFHVWHPADPAGTDSFQPTEAQAKSVAIRIAATHPLWTGDACIESCEIDPTPLGSRAR